MTSAVSTSRSHFVVEYLLALPVGAIVALVWANLAGDTYFRLSYAMSFVVNEVALVFFFGWITKEIVEATAPGGVFHPRRRAWWPALAAMSGVLAAMVLYRFAVAWFESPRLATAWPALFAIDLALGYFIARVIFGRHPAVTFFLLMAIISNGAGFIVLAVTHPLRQVNLAAGAVLMALALTAAAIMRVRGVRSFWPYVLVGGPLSWWALYLAGFHAAFALVPILAFLPHGRRDPGFFVDAAPGARNALDQFELWCRGPAQIALLLFGFVNVGVPLHGLERGQWALPLAMLAGKPLGVVALAAVAAIGGASLPQRIHWRELLVIGIISGVGFTLALFFAGVAFPPGQLLTETRAGALITAVGCALALASAAIHRVGRFAR